MNEEKLKLNHLNIAPRKVRLVTDILRGLSINEAEAQLFSIPNRAASVLLKLFKSAEANIKNNSKKDPSKYFVHSIQVDGGPMLKRMMARARGRGTPIQKKTSHITLVLRESEKVLNNNFKIVIEKPKSLKKIEKKEANKKSYEDHADHTHGKIEEKPGFLQKVFRRKSI